MGRQPDLEACNFRLQLAFSMCPLLGGMVNKAASAEVRNINLLQRSLAEITGLKSLRHRPHLLYRVIGYSAGSLGWTTRALIGGTPPTVSFSQR